MGSQILSSSSVEFLTSVLCFWRSEKRLMGGWEGAEREASRKDLEEVEAFWASVSEAVGTGSS